MSQKKFAVGAVVGALAGIVAGVLTAPKSGKETRADLEAKAAELKSSATNKLSDVEGKVQSATETLKDKFKK